MTFETWWIEEAERDERAIYLARSAWDAATEQAQQRIDELEEKLKVLLDDNALTIAYMQGFSDGKAPKDYVLMPIEPSPAMIQAMVWWCPELNLSTGDLVEFYQDMIRAEHDKEQE